MTMLTYAHSPSQGRGAEAKPGRDIRAAGTLTKASKLSRIKQAGRFAFSVTLVTVALAAIIALDALIYLARFSH